MSQVRLLMDEDAMHSGLVSGLRARNVDLRTVFEAGLVGRDDPDVLAYAIRDDRTVYTFNVGDFCRLHAESVQQGKDHAGIIVVPHQRYSVGEQLRRLLRLINAQSAESMKNQLLFL